MRNICQEFITTCETFKWFIIKYFGEKAFLALLELANNDKTEDLLEALHVIWFQLPDNQFNIIENPKGWKEFLNLIEE
jgi:hypothetical protein